MSRSGYSEDYGCDEPWRLNLYRGRVHRALQGKRGQAFLRGLAVALDAMPEKKLGSRSFQRTADGAPCTLGCVARAWGVDTSDIDAHLDEAPDDYVADAVAERLNIAECMAAEIMYENDDNSWPRETPEGRWQRMRNWVDRHLKGGLEP